MSVVPTERAAPQAAAAAALPPDQLRRIAATAQQFEAMAIGQLLAPIFDSVDTAHGPFGGGQAEAQWKPFLVAELGKNISAAGGLGLARPIMEQMIRMQEVAR